MFRSSMALLAVLVLLFPGGHAFQGGGGQGGEQQRRRQQRLLTAMRRPHEARQLLTHHNDHHQWTVVEQSRPWQVVEPSWPCSISTTTTMLHQSSTGSSSNEASSRTSTNNSSSNKKKSSVKQSVFNLVKAIVGAGVLTLPAGIAAFGNAPSAVIPAVVLIALIGTASGYGFGLIGRVCALTGTTNFRDAWSQAISKESSTIPAMTVSLKTLCAILAYSIILAETGQSLALSVGLNLTMKVTLLGITGCLLLPLCLLKDLSSLAPFSLLGSLGMVYTTLAMAIRYFGHAYLPGGRFATSLPLSLRPSFGLVGATGVWQPSSTILLGMLSTAYMAHFNAPKFYTELDRPTVPRYLKVVSISFAVSIALFAAVASLGFLTFGGASSGLILNNYSTKDTLMGFSRVAVATSIVLGYPLAFTGARDGLLDLFRIQNRSNRRMNLLTVGLLSAITGLAMIVPDVSFVLALAGATLGNCLIYVFPGLMFRGAVARLSSPTKQQKFEVKLALTSAIMGLGLGAMGATQAIRSFMIKVAAAAAAA